jgi:PPP family 3-phenylpropionic acid transporter
VIRVGCVLAVLPFLWLLRGDHSLLSLAVIIFCYSFFWNAVLAQFEAVTLVHLGKKAERYSRIRLWGSIGFIVAVASFGWLFDRVSIAFFPVVVTFALLSIFFSSCIVQDPVLAEAHSDHRLENARFWQRVRQPSVAIFFCVCFLMVLSHGSYYTFFSLLMERYQHSHTVIGLLWSLGVVAEVILFWYMPRLLPVCGVRNLLLLCLSLTVVRWLLLAVFPQSMETMLFAQCLHAFSFAGFHAGAIETVRRLFPIQQSGKAQAFYSAVGYGGGNALGALSSGAVWQFGAFWPFFMSALVCSLAVFLVWRYLPSKFFDGIASTENNLLRTLRR